MDDNTHSTAPAAAEKPAEDPADATGITLLRPTIVGALYLLNIFLGFSVFIGLVLAYVWRSDGVTQDWEKTHFTYLIRTFWIGLGVIVAVFAVWVAAIMGMALNPDSDGNPPSAWMFISMIGGMLLMAATAIWFCIRCIMSLVRAGDRQPMPKPETWLF